MIRLAIRPSRRLPIAQLARFATSGGVVAALYVATTTALLAAGAHPQFALVVGYLAGVALHFTLNRRFVFRSPQGFTHRLSAQAVRYLGVASTAYVVTAVALAVLPAALGLSEVIVFLGVTGVVALVNFAVLRAWVFRTPGDAA